MAFQYLSLPEPVLQSINLLLYLSHGLSVPVSSRTCPTVYKPFTIPVPWPFSTCLFQNLSYSLYTFHFTSPMNFGTCLFQYVSFTLYIFQSTCPKVFYHLPTPVPVLQFIHLSVHLSHGLSQPTCSSTCPTVYHLSIHLSQGISPPTCSSTCPQPIHLLVHLTQGLSVPVRSTTCPTAHTLFNTPIPWSFCTCL